MLVHATNHSIVIFASRGPVYAPVKPVTILNVVMPYTGLETSEDNTVLVKELALVLALKILMNMLLLKLMH